MKINKIEDNIFSHGVIAGPKEERNGYFLTNTLSILHKSLRVKPQHQLYSLRRIKPLIK